LSCGPHGASSWVSAGCRRAAADWVLKMAGFRVDSSGVTRPPLDPARGAEVAQTLRDWGVKGILVRAAEFGYITEVKCGMPKCFCPEELGGAWHFEPLAAGYSDWNPTHEHFPVPKRDGGHRTVDNSVLAHRLCNRIDYSMGSGRSHASDLERIRRAREAAAGS
jgi:hypothetical protein